MKTPETLQKEAYEENMQFVYIVLLSHILSVFDLINLTGFSLHGDEIMWLLLLSVAMQYYSPKDMLILLIHILSFFFPPFCH